MGTSHFTVTLARELLSDNKVLKDDETLKNVINSTHIYTICKIPTFYFNKETISLKNNILSGEIIYKVKGNQKKVFFKRKMNFNNLEITMKISDYPYKEISFLHNNKEISYLPAYILGIYHGIHEQKLDDIRNFEVLYIGQSFGDGSRNTFDRLKSHSTLQKILADTAYSYPDDEVYILSFVYEDYRIFENFDGKSNLKNFVENKERYESILDNPLSKQEQICLVEAALIRYFQPKFNKIYKENFPSFKHKVLEQCYNLDFSGLVVEINTEELDIRLYSDNIKPNTYHISKINLIEHEDRYSFFHLTLDANSPAYIPQDVIS